MPDKHFFLGYCNVPVMSKLLVHVFTIIANIIIIISIALTFAHDLTYKSDEIESDQLMQMRQKSLITY
jgi:hypothetical protein